MGVIALLGATSEIQAPPGSDLSSPATGQIALSITSGGADTVIELRPVDGGPNVKITASPGGVFGGKGDFKLPTEEIKSKGALDGSGLHYMKSVSWRGKVIVKAVPAGRYALVRVSASQSGGGGMTAGGTMFSLQVGGGGELNIPVSVSPGRTTYIGEYRTLYVATKGPLGWPMWQGFRYVVSDQSVRDLPLARKEHPDLGSVDIDIPAVDGLHKGWIGSEP